MNRMWFLIQIVLMVIGTAFTYIHRPNDNGWFWIPPLFGFCFSYWVTWAIFKLIDAPSKVGRLLRRAKALWF